MFRRFLCPEDFYKRPQAPTVVHRRVPASTGGQRPCPHRTAARTADRIRIISKRVSGGQACTLHRRLWSLAGVQRRPQACRDRPEAAQKPPETAKPTISKRVKKSVGFLYTYVRTGLERASKGPQRPPSPEIRVKRTISKRV